MNLVNTPCIGEDEMNLIDTPYIGEDEISIVYVSTVKD
jgi:hypothetical protein